MGTFELLAPAGSFEILKAVITAGADAVYVGGNMFGARAYANNFSQEELIEAIHYVHVRKKRLYLTVNTLMKNKEIQGQLYEFLAPLYEEGLDGVIVQDLGAVQFIHTYFPEMEIHTSTQMTITGIEGANYLKQFGVTRVVMAREMSLGEMQLIRQQTGLELEAFIHGALCYCYSGQCLFSSILGGRSGNRGRCAQPCRLPYTVLDQSKKRIKDECYILSLKDMCGISSLADLAKAGVYSLKIEGRMKQVEYAANTVAMYRKYIDYYESLQDKSDFSVKKEDREALMDYGNRCGFTNKYYYHHNDSDMITYVKPSFEKKEIDFSGGEERKKIPIQGKLRLKVLEPARLEVYLGDYMASATGIEVSVATNRPMQPEDILSRIQKTGDTIFEFEQLESEIDENIFIPNGAINQLRREALVQLQEFYMSKYKRKLSTLQQKMPEWKENGAQNKTCFVASVETREQLSAVMDCSVIEEIYLYPYLYEKNHLWDNLQEDVERICAKGKKVFFAFPQIMRNHDYEFYKSNVEKFKGLSLSGIVVTNYETLGFVRKYLSHLPMIFDHNMYTYNNYAQQAFMDEKPSICTIPLELNYGEIMNRGNVYTEMIVYGYYPLMTTAQCIYKNSMGCKKDKTVLYLKDRYKKEFPVRNYCESCYNMIYNSLPTMLLGTIDKVSKTGMYRYRLSFTIEKEKEVQNILSMAEYVSRHKQLPGDFDGTKYTYGHFKRGVE